MNTRIDKWIIRDDIYDEKKKKKKIAENIQISPCIQKKRKKTELCNIFVPVQQAVLLAFCGIYNTG